MKIYTFFLPINEGSGRSSRLQILKSWENSWRKNGFEPIILDFNSLKKANPYLSEYFQNIKKISNLFFNQLRPYAYDLVCFLRWVIYANQLPNNHFLVSDYDLINKNFSLNDLENLNLDNNKLNFLNGYCPCFAYGNPNQFLDFCKQVNIKSLQKCSPVEIKRSKAFHDQCFIKLYRQYLNCKFYDIHSIVNPARNIEQINGKLYHVSHKSARILKLNRLKIIEKIIN